MCACALGKLLLPLPSNIAILLVTTLSNANYSIDILYSIASKV